MTHSVLGNTLGQQPGVNHHGGGGDVEDPGDLNITGLVTCVQVYSYLLHRQAAHLLLCPVPHHLVIPGAAHHHCQQGSVPLGKCAAVIDAAEYGVRLAAGHQKPESLMVKWSTSAPDVMIVTW